ncbi:hypothetical protein COOONC_15359 [Cooperia oncophora]
MARFLWALSAVFTLCILSSHSYSIRKPPYELDEKGSRPDYAAIYVVINGLYVSFAQENPPTKLRFSPLCVTCNAAVSAMWLVMKLDMSEPVVLQFATLLCKLVAKQSWVVCEGISTQFREEFFYVFRQLAEKNPSAICGLLLDECADPNDPSESGWAVALPPKPTKEMKAIIDKKRAQFAHPKGSSHRYLRVLQLSDMHVDFDYNPGSEAECDLPVCCRATTEKPKKPAGYWGTVGRCDIPYRTLKNMLEHINATAEVDYVMLSGDFINHADWMYSIEEHKKALRNVSALIREFFPLTPTYWAIGNHEGVPVNR